jgi:hypothetical protein
VKQRPNATGAGALSRRRLLARAGLAVAASPFLGRAARAQQTGGPPLRLICWPLFNGAESGYFYPGGDSASALSMITEPLRKYADLVTFIRGVNISGSVNHYAIRSMYTGGNVSSYTSPDPTVASIDQLIANHIAKTAPTPVKSVHLGVIPADSLAAYHRGQSMVFFAPARVDYEANPVTAFDRLFGGGAAAPQMPRGIDLSDPSRALLDAEMNELATRATGIASEARKLELHRESWKGLRASARPGGPAPVAAGGPLPSVEKLRPLIQGNAKDAYKRDYFADLFDAQVDNMARVLVTGLSRVVTIQPGSADNNLIVPVGRGFPHHNTSHGNQATFSTVQRYYFTKMARLLEAIDVPDPLDPGRTVLDNSLLVMIAECLPVSHSSNGVPTMLVGKLGGKVNTGRTINQGGITNKNVMATVLRAFGLDGAHFGSTLVNGVLS